MTGRLIVIGSTVLALAAGCARAPQPELAPPAEVVREAVAPPPVLDLYTSTWPSWDVRLVGVDAEGRHAVVRLAQRDAPIRVVFDTLDLETGRRVSRWEAREPCTESLVRGDAVFRCVDGAPDDLERYAGMLGSVGPWHTRGTLSHPVVSSGPEAVAYLAAPTDGQDGDWVRVRDAQGDVRIGRDRAGYDPVWTPRGELVYRVCEPRPGGCRWSLRLRERDGQVRVLDSAPTRPPVLSADGAQAFVITGRQRDCVERVSIASGESTPLGCGAPDRRVRVSDGGRVVLSWAFGEGAVQMRDLSQGEGPSVPVHVVPGISGVGAVSDAGAVALAGVDGELVVLQLGSGARETFTAPTGRFSGLAASRWTTQGLVLLRTAEGSFAVTRVRAGH